MRLVPPLLLLLLLLLPPLLLLPVARHQVTSERHLRNAAKGWACGGTASSELVPDSAAAEMKAGPVPAPLQPLDEVERASWLARLQMGTLTAANTQRSAKHARMNESPAAGTHVDPDVFQDTCILVGSSESAICTWAGRDRGRCSVRRAAPLGAQRER